MFGSEEYFAKEKEAIRTSDNLEAMIEIIIEHSIKNIEEQRKMKECYASFKYKTDPKFNLNSRISTLIWSSLRNNSEGKKNWENKVGYNMTDLIKRLMNTIPKGYIWQDYLEGKLHIDHIIPKKVFNFTKPEHPDFRRCWALKNLRLLPARENLIKGAKLARPFQPSLAL